MAYDVTPAITLYQQSTPYDCWHASLKMMWKWRTDNMTNPSGFTMPRGPVTEWLYDQCRRADAGYKFNYQQYKLQVIQPDVNEQQSSRNASKQAQKVVSKWSRQQHLMSNQGQYFPFNERPGLTLALLPTILAENQLRAVRGSQMLHIQKELSGSPQEIEQMLSTHGPLYCLADFGHVVVVSGIDNQTLHVYDPLSDAGPVGRGLWLIKNSPCVARIASFNVGMG